MFASTRLDFRLGGLCSLLLLVLVAGCAHRPLVGSGADDRDFGATAFDRAEDGPDQSLQGRLAALAPSVRPEEAERAAVCAQDYPLQLAREYRVVRPPFLHNILVNIGFKKRGLCWHWADDLGAMLQSLNLSTLEVRWATARTGTAREHNAVVLSANDQAFEDGILLDAWRHSGRLFWTRVSEDRYPWGEVEWFEGE